MNRVMTQQYETSSLQGRQYLLLFIIWPFLAFITAIANFKHKEAKKVVYFFLIYYGLCFVNQNEGVDAYRYALDLKENASLPFSDFFKIVGGLYATDTSVDIVEPFISFIVSRFTSDPGIYFAVWAAIFGYFYLKSIDLLHTRHVMNPGWNGLILMIFFIFILPITSISGVRMWTAAWIFFYGAIHVVINRDPKFLLLTLAASLVHWSFISANLILIGYFLAGNRNIIYIPLTLASFVVPQMQTISLRLGGGIQNRFDNYSSEGYIQAVQDSREQTVWFMQIGGDLVFYFLIFAIIVIQILSFAREKEKDEKNLFSFLLVFLTFVNFGMAIPSFGGRFQVLFFLFATFYLFIHFVKQDGSKINLLILAGLFPMLLYAAINFRLGSESINAWLLTPGFGIPLFAADLPLSNFIF